MKRHYSHGDFLVREQDLLRLMRFKSEPVMLKRDMLVYIKKGLNVYLVLLEELVLRDLLFK